jgi:hypothetical protein
VDSQDIAVLLEILGFRDTVGLLGSQDTLAPQGLVVLVATLAQLAHLGFRDIVALQEVLALVDTVAQLE